MDAEEASAIGARAATIRRRRGLSQDVVAGLAGISKPYLSQLEHGQRGFNRRGLIEELAAALGCSVADLTRQPYLPLDRNAAEVLASLPTIRIVLNDSGPMDVPDLTRAHRWSWRGSLTEPMKTVAGELPPCWSRRR